MLGVVICAVIVLVIGAFALSIIGLCVTDDAIKTFKENN